MPRPLSRSTLAVFLFLFVAALFSSAQQQVASLHPANGLVWQRTSPTAQKPEGPVLYQLLFNASGIPGTIPVFDTNPRHLTNSPITITGSNVSIGGASGLSINGTTGIVTFASGQIFSAGTVTLAGDVTGPSSAVVVTGLQTVPVSNQKPTSGQVLSFNGSAWTPIAGGGLTGNLAGEVTGPASATVVSNAVSANTASAIVRRDASGNFSAGTASLAGNLALPNTSSASVGGITLGGTQFLHSFGTANTFLGANAGNTTVLTGSDNTGVGFGALQNNTAGVSNSAFGAGALSSNSGGTGPSTGSSNSAFGARALTANTMGPGNSAFGVNALSSNTTAAGNSAFGVNALLSNTTGFSNAAFGSDALESNTTGLVNSAFGVNALSSNTTATGNDAFGGNALLSNTTGFSNSAFGGNALGLNVMGTNNSAFGESALFSNTASDNSAFGMAALYHNTTGTRNSAFGEALTFNTTGADNSAFGFAALNDNTTGQANEAFGSGALFRNTSGGNNSALGNSALQNLIGGNLNIAIGDSAGSALSASESNNIYIGNLGTAGESSTIRIGTVGTQTAAFMAGVSGATSAGGVAVFVNASGQLGTATSSRRFKQDIADMGTESDLLMQLRPVAFYYKPELDSTHTRQYGLVAEEVAELAPGLVVFDKDGKPETVRYHFVNAMLLNEVQKQRRLIGQQQQQLATQQNENEELRSTIALQQGQIQVMRREMDEQKATMQQQMDTIMLRLASVERTMQLGTQVASAR